MKTKNRQKQKPKDGAIKRSEKRTFHMSEIEALESAKRNEKKLKRPIKHLRYENGVMVERIQYLK